MAIHRIANQAPDLLRRLDKMRIGKMSVADAVWNRWLAGAVLAQSEGEGGFSHATARRPGTPRP